MSFFKAPNGSHHCCLKNLYIQSINNSERKMVFCFLKYHIGTRTMSRYAGKKVKCKCCGKQYDARFLQSYYSDSPMGLDTNPHMPEIYDSVILCPHCGYATDDVTQSVDSEVRNFVESSEYQKMFTDKDFDENLKKLLLSAQTEEMKKDFRKAAYQYLEAFWRAKEIDNEQSCKIAGQAVDNFSKYLEETKDLDAAMILVDLLRQTRNFKEAAETAESLAGFIPKDGKFIQSVLAYEEKLIAERDSDAHNVSEVAQ